jgi:hypothetical protein
MADIIGIQDYLLVKYPNQNLIINSPFGSIVSIYKDEEFGISGGLEYKNLGEIISDISDMTNQAGDIASSFSGTAGAIVGFGKSVLNSGSNIKKISSGFRDEATPWMGFQKAIAHTHGNITLNFIITRQLKDVKELLNKMSMQEISSTGMWEYLPTDSLKTLFSDTSGSMSSMSALTTGSRDAKKNLDDFDGKLGAKLMGVSIGSWFRADMLIIDSIDYRIKTAVFDDSGSPEYMEVTMNLKPIRKLSATEISGWFPNLHNKPSSQY